MPTLPDPAFAVGDILEVTSVNYYQAQLGLMIWHMVIDDVAGGDPQSLDAVANKLDTVFGPLQRDIMSANASHRGMRVRRVFPDESSYVEGITEQGDGAVAGDALPTQTSGILTLRTSFPGRSNRGRKYFPFPPETMSTSEGKPDTDYITGLNAWATGMSTPTTIVVMAAVVLSMRLVIYRRAAPALSPLVTAFRANPKWATQRRRGVYGKPNALPF